MMVSRRNIKVYDSFNKQDLKRKEDEEEVKKPKADTTFISRSATQMSESLKNSLTLSLQLEKSSLSQRDSVNYTSEIYVGKGSSEMTKSKTKSKANIDAKAGEKDFRKPRKKTATKFSLFPFLELMIKVMGLNLLILADQMWLYILTMLNIFMLVVSALVSYFL